MTLIKVIPNIAGMENSSVLDVSMRKASNEDLPFLWRSEAPILYRLRTGWTVPISDAYSVYLDQRIAAEGNTRPEKRAARERRLQLMRKYIFYPRTSQATRRADDPFLPVKTLWNRNFRNTTIKGKKVTNLIANTEWPGGKLPYPMPVTYYMVPKERRRSSRRSSRRN